MFAILEHLQYLLFCVLYQSEKNISYFSTKTYVVGIQKSPLNETVLLSTQNK